MLECYTTGTMPNMDYPRGGPQPEYDRSLIVDGKPISLSLCDTAGKDDFICNKLRPLSYPKTVRQLASDLPIVNNYS
jgi:hypothetical protein